MNKTKLILFLAALVLAQDIAPEWIEESWRLARYPKSEWYIGYAKDNIKGQPGSKDYQAMEKQAQSNLSEKIIVEIQSSTVLQTASRQNNAGEFISTDYQKNISTQTSAILAKVETRSYYDRKNGFLYAFAAVRKTELAEFYGTKINGLLASAENEFSLAGQLADAGKKKSALNRINAMEDTLSKIGYWANLLQAVAGATTDNRPAEMLQRANAAKIALEDGTAIHLSVSGSEYIAEELGAALQKAECNCSIVQNISEADYAISVKAKPNRCGKPEYGLVYCFTNATVSVKNSKTNKNIPVQIPEASAGWPSHEPKRAVEESYRELTESIAKELSKEIRK
jgi:hypothetical protein